MTCLTVSCVVNESPRAWWMSLGISLVTHILVLAAVATWSILGAFESSAIAKAPPSPEMEMTYTRLTSAARGTAGADPVENILGSIPERIRQMQELTPAQKTAIIKDGQKGLAMVRESSLHEIADLFGVEDRAYEPADPRPAGAFDIDSQILYSMKETENDGYAMVMVDKAGRTLEITYPAEEVTDNLRALAEVFKMMDETPALRTIYRMTVNVFPELKGGKGKDD